MSLSPKNDLKDYCYTSGAPGHYDAGVMFFCVYHSAIRRCVIHVNELYTLPNSESEPTPTAFEQVYADYRTRINAAADDQLLHGDDRETVIIRRLFLNLSWLL